MTLEVLEPPVVAWEVRLCTLLGRSMLGYLVVGLWREMGLRL